MNYTERVAKIGTKVIWLRTKATDSTTQEIAEGTITKVGKSYGEHCVWIDNNHKSEDALLVAFLYPDAWYTRHLLKDTLEMADRHKKEQREMQARAYKLRNSIVNGECDNLG